MIDQARLIKMTRRVLSMNSENPPGRELALAEFIDADMRSLGLTVRRHSFAKDRPNIVATRKGSWPRKKAAAEALLITPHIDTVPIGGGWTKDPLGGQVIGGKIYGRGASDDKGNLACCLEVMRSLVEDRVELKRDLIMAATVDEETGSKQGILPLLEKKILTPRVALILDSDEYAAIVAQKGLLHCRVRIQGRKAHGAYNWLGENAIELAGRVIGRIKRHKFAHRRHALLHGPTVNVGTIHGGDKVNMVADRCEFSLDVRFLPGMNARQVIAQIKQLIRAETRRFEFIIDDLQQPYEIDPAHPFVRAYTGAGRAVGVKVPLRGSEGATVMTFFKRHRIPAFATGYGARGTAHCTDEYARVATLYKGTRLLEQFIKDYDQL